MASHGEAYEGQHSHGHGTHLTFRSSTDSCVNSPKLCFFRVETSSQKLDVPYPLAKECLVNLLHVIVSAPSASHTMSCGVWHFAGGGGLTT